MKPTAETLSPQQIKAIKYAFADLCGSYQAVLQGNPNLHVWVAHKMTIRDIVDAFPDLGLEMPDDVKEGGLS